MIPNHPAVRSPRFWRVIVIALLTHLSSAVEIGLAQSLLGQLAGPVAERFVESAGNRVVDGAVPALASGLEGLPGGAVLHPLADGILASAVKAEPVDWGRAIFSAGGAAALGTVLAPQVAVGAIAVDMAGSYLGELAWDNREYFPGKVTRSLIGYAGEMTTYVTDALPPW